MSDPSYIVYIRVSRPRGDFVDPPQVHWDSTKDDALWKILSGAAQTEINWTQAAERFDVPVDFLLQQVAYLTERHASQVRAQVRKASAAAKGSAAPSPVPGAESAAAPGHQRTASALSARRESNLSRNENTSTTTTATTTTTTVTQASTRPAASRDVPVNMAALKDATATSARHGSSSQSRPVADLGSRKRLSSLQAAAPAAAAPTSTTNSPDLPAESRLRENMSPGPAESSSNDSSDDDASPVQSRIIRRPPRFQQQQADGTEPYLDDGDDESEPAFKPYQAAAADQIGQDMGSTLKGHAAASTTGRRSHQTSIKDKFRQPLASDDSLTGSPVAVGRSKQRDPRIPGPLSPTRATDSAGRSPLRRGKSKASSREGSEGTPSMGSSYSDLDDASVTQSALEEALASHMNGPGAGASSRFSISQAFRSRYMPGSN